MNADGQFTSISGSRGKKFLLFLWSSRVQRVNDQAKPVANAGFYHGGSLIRLKRHAVRHKGTKAGVEFLSFPIF